MEFFVIDQDLVGAAATASPPLRATKEPIERWVPLLPEAERNAFLVRAARGEPNRSGAAAAAARGRWWAEPGHSDDATAHVRCDHDGVDEVRRSRQERERQEAERARLAKLDALAKREEQVWAQVPELLARRTASGYDEAVAHMADLRDLAVHRNQRAAFDARLGNMLAPYATSGALLRRLREQKLAK